MQGMLLHVLAVLGGSTAVVMVYALLLVVRPHPWWSAQYLISILGLLLGTCLTCVATGLSCAVDELSRGELLRARPPACSMDCQQSRVFNEVPLEPPAMREYPGHLPCHLHPQRAPWQGFRFTALHKVGSLCRIHDAGRDTLEQWLLLGASRWEATHGLIQKATMAALAPTLSHISVMGLVTIPSAMAGQLLGGSAPVQVQCQALCQV